MVVECGQTTVCLEGGVCTSDTLMEEPTDYCHCAEQYLEPDCAKNRGIRVFSENFSAQQDMNILNTTWHSALSCCTGLGYITDHVRIQPYPAL